SVFARRACADIDANHPSEQGDQPGGLRCQRNATGDERVGVKGGKREAGSGTREAGGATRKRRSLRASNYNRTVAVPRFSLPASLFPRPPRGFSPRATA